MSDVAHVGWTVLPSFSRRWGAKQAGPSLALAASEKGNAVMKIYGPNCVALVEFFLPPSLTSGEEEGGEGAVWFGLVWIGGCLYLYAALPSLRIC